jgi:hypothetical protein
LLGGHGLVVGVGLGDGHVLDVRSALGLGLGNHLSLLSLLVLGLHDRLGQGLSESLLGNETLLGNHTSHRSATADDLRGLRIHFYY